MFSVTLFRDPSNWTLSVYRKPPVMLKIVPRKPANDTSNNSREAKMKSTNYREEKLDRISDAASGTIFRISKCFQRS
jgi:hypothetical protein